MYPDLALSPTDPKARTKYRIVDADAHLNPPHDIWAEYLPARLRELGPQIEPAKPGEDHDWVVFEGTRRPFILAAAQAGREGKDFKKFGKVSDQRAGGWMPAERLKDMDQDGMDAAVLFGGGPLGTTNSELLIESYRAYNRWLADFCAYDPKRFAGVAYLPMRNIDESTAMLREAAALGFRTVNIPAFPQSSDGFTSGSAKVKALHEAQSSALTGNPDGELEYIDPAFDKFWAAVTELDITLTIHLGGKVSRFGDKRYFLADLVMTKLAMAEPIARLIYAGVFDRFPTLRFASMESGVGWLAWMAEYMDRTWEKQRFWMECELKNPPSFYMDQNIYGSFINDREGVLNYSRPGGRNIMWSSDYPHSETTYPNSRMVIERDFVGIPEKDVREIVGGRAAKLFGVN